MAKINHQSKRVVTIKEKTPVHLLKDLQEMDQMDQVLPEVVEEEEVGSKLDNPNNPRTRHITDLDTKGKVVHHHKAPLQVETLQTHHLTGLIMKLKTMTRFFKMDGSFHHLMNFFNE